jgi:pimeloyl-ACP methyl ester carboxylesterase
MSAPVILLHGQPGGAGDWQQVRVALRERRQVIVPDRPGWDGASEPQGVAGNGRAVVALLDRLGLERATLAGHSFAGAIACWVAANAPERTSGLLLAAPAANQASLFTFDRWLATPVLGAVAAAGLLGSAGLVLSSRRARHVVAGRAGMPEGYLRSAGRSLRSPRAWRAFAVEQQALLRELPELERRLPAIAAPTRIVIGADDRVVPVRSAALLSSQIADATLTVLPGAGHLLPVFSPEPLAEAILELP